MTLLLPDLSSAIFGTTLQTRMFVGIVMIIFYLGVVEIMHYHKPKEKMREIFLPITLVLLFMFMLIILRKLIS